jgi:hypothetical protein
LGVDTYCRRPPTTLLIANVPIPAGSTSSGSKVTSCRTIVMLESMAR